MCTLMCIFQASPCNMAYIPMKKKQTQFPAGENLNCIIWQLAHHNTTSNTWYRPNVGSMPWPPISNIDLVLRRFCRRQVGSKSQKVYPEIPGKHEALPQCCFADGLPSETLA